MDQASQPASPTHDENYDETLKLLRRSWKWAAASDFLYKFNPMLHLDFLDLSDVEYDLIRGTSETIFPVFTKILHVLTSIRGLSMDTWEMYLRRLYARRVPENLIWGTENEPIHWRDLGWTDRLEILYTLCEWEFQSPMKVRQAMKDDSDDAAWRSAPIGRDSKRNLYWRFGRDRLWIQRYVEEPTPQRPLKRKKHPTKPTAKNTKRKPTVKGGNKPKAAAKEKGTSQKKLTQSTAAASGTRVSSRLARGSRLDGWQKVPDDWLNDQPKKSENGPDDEKANLSSLFDDASDLTDLSDDDSKSASARESSKSAADTDTESDLTESDDDVGDHNPKGKGVNRTKSGATEGDSGPFIEFETVCITITEWRDFAERFRSVRSHNERRLFRYITEVAIPELEEYQRATEEKERKELKEMQRREQAAAAAAAAEARPKRSTRLAALAVEEERARHSSGGSSVDGDHSDAPGRSSRGRRAALRYARWQREQQELLAEAIGEDDGDVETEKRERKSFGKVDQDEYQDESDEVRPPPSPLVNGMGRPRRAAAVAAEQKRPPIRTRRRRGRSDSEDDEESEEPFFLSCEICKKSGWNEDYRQHLLACKMCGIWQHAACHDINDKRLEQPKRDWTQEQFLCSTCRTKMQTQRTRRGRKPKAQEQEVQVEGPAQTQSDQPSQNGNPPTIEPFPPLMAISQPVQKASATTTSVLLSQPPAPAYTVPHSYNPPTPNGNIMNTSLMHNNIPQANHITQLPSQYTWQPPLMSHNYHNYPPQANIGMNQHFNPPQPQFPPFMHSVLSNGHTNGTQQLHHPNLPSPNPYYAQNPNGPNGYVYPPQ